VEKSQSHREGRYAARALRILTRYLLARMAATTAVAVLLVAGLIWVLQLLRLGHHLLGGARLAGELLLHSLPTLLVFGLPIGLAGAILHTLGQLAESGELDAMRAFGASPLRLGLPGLLLALVVAAAAGLLGLAEAPALARLERVLGQRAARALIHGAKAGRFHHLAGGTTFYARRRLGAGDRSVRFQGVLLAQEQPSTVMLAREATLRLVGDSPDLALHLRAGELQQLNRRGGLRRVRFGELERTLDLRRGLAAHFGFLGRRAADPQRVAAAMAHTLALGLLATALGLALRSRLRLAAGGILAVAVHQIGCWGMQLVWQAGPLALSAAVALGGLAWLVRSSR
jgi:hypothetical protein